MLIEGPEKLIPGTTRHLTGLIPADIKPRVLSTSIDLVDPTASVDIAMDLAHYFDLTKLGAEQIVKKVSSAVALWREESAKLGIKKREIDRMASAFQH